MPERGTDGYCTTCQDYRRRQNDSKIVGLKALIREILIFVFGIFRDDFATTEVLILQISDALSLFEFAEFLGYIYAPVSRVSEHYHTYKKNHYWDFDNSCGPQCSRSDF